MMEVLQFVFSSFWTWLGTIILILAIAACIPTFKYQKSWTETKK